MITYWEQDGVGNAVEMWVSDATAIALAKGYAASKGHTYPNDREALLDFLVIHWGTWREDK